jgi:hypothetical protein
MSDMSAMQITAIPQSRCAHSPCAVHSIHLVGAAGQRQWDIEAERLCGLEIDHKLEFGRHLHRKVSRLLALQNTIDV